MTKDTDGVIVLFLGDPRANETALMTIETAGSRLPLWVIARGKTHDANKDFEIAVKQRS
jgi:hypothetical protein